jgi:hypothetical protein
VQRTYAVRFIDGNRPILQCFDGIQYAIQSGVGATNIISSKVGGLK